MNPKHFSNTEESVKLLNEIAIPYVAATRKNSGLEGNQYALIILDVFRGKTTQEVIGRL